MVFEFDSEEVFAQQLGLADPGNTCLRGTTEEFNDYYLIIRTILGKTSILKFGPVVPDVEMLLPGFITTYRKFDYKEQAINKEIKLFLNDSKNAVKTVSEISQDEAFSAFPNIAELFYNL